MNILLYAAFIAVAFIALLDLIEAAHGIKGEA
jgi:hypothetical protein